MAGLSSVGAKEWLAAALTGIVVGLVVVHTVGSVDAAADRVAAQVIDRTHKGDRLNVVSSPALDARASGRIALRHLLQGARSRELHEACEPPASPYVDPQLAKLPGRCLS